MATTTSLYFSIPNGPKNLDLSCVVVYACVKSQTVCRYSCVNIDCASVKRQEGLLLRKYLHIHYGLIKRVTKSYLEITRGRGVDIDNKTQILRQLK